jgi:hypothetical protein
MIADGERFLGVGNGGLFYSNPDTFAHADRCGQW